MHELSIALSILDMAAEEAERRGARIISVRLRLGPLSGVVKEALQSSYEMARQETSLADSQLIIEETPLIVFCPRCKVQRFPPSVQHLCCPVCGQPTPEVISGRELEVSALELLQEETAGAAE